MKKLEATTAPRNQSMVSGLFSQASVTVQDALF
jgi:hypothetical protein